MIEIVCYVEGCPNSGQAFEFVAPVESAVCGGCGTELVK